MFTESNNWRLIYCSRGTVPLTQITWFSNVLVWKDFCKQLKSNENISLENVLECILFSFYYISNLDNFKNTFTNILLMLTMLSKLKQHWWAKLYDFCHSGNTAGAADLCWSLRANKFVNVRPGRVGSGFSAPVFDAFQQVSVFLTYHLEVLHGVFRIRQNHHGRCWYPGGSKWTGKRINSTKDQTRVGHCIEWNLKTAWFYTSAYFLLLR